MAKSNSKLNGMKSGTSKSTVRFTPSQVIGLDNVFGVEIDSESILLHTSNGNRHFLFATIGRRQESWTRVMLKRCLLRRPWPKLVASRSWCLDPLKAYFVFYTEPKIAIYMPADDVSDYATCCFSRIRDLIHSGRYAATDLN